jgi:hypothetical protein
MYIFITIILLNIVLIVIHLIAEKCFFIISASVSLPGKPHAILT